MDRNTMRVTTRDGRYARLVLSSMGEPMLTLAEADRLRPFYWRGGEDVDTRLRRAAQLFPGWEVKGLGLSVAYLRRV